MRLDLQREMSRNSNDLVVIHSAGISNPVLARLSTDKDRISKLGSFLSRYFFASEDSS